METNDKKEQRLRKLIKDGNIYGEIFSWIWMSSWFVAIWYNQYAIQLVLTGTFAFFLAYAFGHTMDKDRKELEEL